MNSQSKNQKCISVLKFNLSALHTRRIYQIIGIIFMAIVAQSCAVNFSVSDHDGFDNQAMVFVIQQQSPKLNFIDHGVDGPSQGDHLFFTAPISDEKGNIGTLFGQLTTLKTNHKIGDVEVDVKTGYLVFDFYDYELVVMGNTHYNPTVQEMNHQKEQVRSVVGGAGKMKGAKGHVITVRNPDGTYTHTFELF